MAAQYGIDIVVKALGGPAIGQVANELKKVETAAKAAQGGINNAANNIRGFGAAAQSTGNAVSNLGSKFAGFAAQLGLTVGAMALVKNSLDATFSRDAAETRLKNLTSSSQEYELAMKMAAVASQRFGITQTEATKALGDVYGRLQGVGYGLKEINQIYTGFNVIAKQSGMAAEEASGAFFQLSQALGKGKLNGDEFVIIAERMPQLLDAIAQTTGASRGELTQMAQEGKITGDVLYKALAGSVAGANNLNGALTKQQTTMADVARYADEMRVQLGAALAPAFLAIMQNMGAAAMLLSKGFQSVATWAKQNESAIVAIVNGLLKFGAAVAIVFGVVKAFQALQVAIAAAAAAKAFLIGLTGKGLLLVAAAAGGAALAYKGLSDTIDGVGQHVGQLQKEATAEMTAMTAEIEKQQNAYSSLPEKIDDAKEAAKELKKEQQAVAEAIQEASSAADRQAQAQIAAVDGMLQVTQARLQAETAVNQVLLDQAQRQLQAATSQQERIKAAQQIYHLTVQNAQLELQSTRAQIEAELEKSRIAVESAKLKEREITAVVQLAIAQRTVTAAHFEALNAQRQAVGQAEKLQMVALQVATAQNRAADAVYRGKVAAAEAAYHQNIVAKNTQTAAQNSEVFAGNMARAANSAAAAATSMASTAKGSGVNASQMYSQIFGPAASNPYFMKMFQDEMHRYQNGTGGPEDFERAYRDLMNRFIAMARDFNNKNYEERMRQAQEDFYKGYATGGYVSKPEMAMIGEGGEPEYVIPASKMNAALANYAAGHRGSSVVSSTPQVNIKTGPVTQIDGVNYVTHSDLARATGTAVSQTLKLLRSDPAVRRQIGVSR